MKTVSLVYTGKRQRGDKVKQVFQYEGESYAFSGVKALRIGYAYEVETKDGKRGSFLISSVPNEVGDYPVASEAQILEWEAEEVAAIQFEKRMRAANKYKKHPAILECAERLKLLLRGSSYTVKREVVGFLIDEIEREEREADAKETRERLERSRKRYLELEKSKAKEVKTNGNSSAQETK